MAQDLPQNLDPASSSVDMHIQVEGDTSEKKEYARLPRIQTP